MAAANSFSYAQAAKAPAKLAPAPQAQAASNKAETTSQPASTAAFSELTPGSNWADDVDETTVGVKTEDAPKAAPEQPKSVQPKETAVERTKSEDKNPIASSGVSTPDLGAESSTTTKDDDASSAPNGSASETTWDSKSQGSSEPSWIAERKERQSGSPNSESTTKGEKKRGEAPEKSAPKPVALHDAPPPPVNPWLKRAEDTKPKVAPQPAPRPVSTAHTETVKENQKPKEEPKKKPAQAPVTAKVEETQVVASANAKKTAAPQGGKRANEARPNNVQQGPKQAASATPTHIPKRSNLPNLSTAVPPPVKDETAWPTPDTAPEKERKDITQKESPEKQIDDTTPTNKSRKGQWQSMVVTPNIIFETQNIRGREAPRGAERGGRGALRARGGLRGTAGADRAAGRANSSGSEDNTASNATQRGRAGAKDREAAASADKPVRATSASSYHDQNKSGKTGVDSKKEGNDNTKSSGRPKSAKQGDADSKDESDPTSQNENGEASAEGASSKPNASENRKEMRNGDNNQSLNGPTRGNKRGGRGRGGSREFANGHQANHAFANGQPAEFNGQFGVPGSPSVNARGNHQFPYPTQGRGGWGRGNANSRSQSIPVDNFYNRFQQPYGAPQAMPFVPGQQMYDPNQYAMMGMPYQPYAEHQFVVAAVITQLDYYFSVENLIKDIFLRKNMDSQGFVYLDVIADFNKIKYTTTDKDLIRTACINSEVVEILVGDDNKERLRKREGWEQFVLPMDQRNPGAQTEGPKQLQHPERPQLQVYGAAQFPHGMQQQQQQRPDRKSYDSGPSTMNGFAPPFVAYPSVPEGNYGMMNGEDARGRAAKSPSHGNGIAATPQAESDEEPDSFPDEQAAVLTVVVKVNPQEQKDQKSVPFHSAASRTFSNGSIDSRSILSEMDNKSEASKTNGEAIASSTDASADVSRVASPSNTDRGSTDSNISLFWMKDQPKPAEELPSNLTLEPYVQLRLKALDQRSHAATGTCPYDMDVLYQFWCHFLIRNFNGRMYSEFKYFANEDAKERHNFVGLQNLLKFYSQALLSPNPIRERLVKDYVELVKNEPAKLDGTGFKQLRSAWRNGALHLKNRKKLADIVDATLKERLEA